MAGATATVLALIIGLSCAWLAFQHIPSWYDPPELSEDDLPGIRAALPAKYQEFTDSLIEGGTFEFRLSARSVNEWLAARTALWPDSRNMLPGWLWDPVVVFRDDRIILAARFDSQGWRAIASLHLKLTVEPDMIVVRIARTAAGSLSLPTPSILKAIDRLAARLLEENEELADSVVGLSESGRRNLSIHELENGLRIENRFHWTNGDRHFRIVSVRAANGLLTLQVQAL